MDKDVAEIIRDHYISRRLLNGLVDVYNSMHRDDMVKLVSAGVVDEKGKDAETSEEIGEIPSLDSDKGSSGGSSRGNRGKRRNGSVFDKRDCGNRGSQCGSTS